MPKLGIRLNLSNGGMSQVSGWDFNSIATLDDVTYAMDTGGLSTLGGDLDDTSTITSYFSTPLHDLSIKHPKRIRKMYLQYVTDGLIKLTCIPNEEETGFTVTLDTASVPLRGVSKVIDGRRDYRGTEWEFTVSNVAGADFSIDYLGALFIPLTRSRSL